MTRANPATTHAPHSDTNTAIDVRDLTMAWGERVIQRDLNFTVARGAVFVIMGPSGCGKSTLLKHMIGLHRPTRGDVHYDGQAYFAATPREQRALRTRWGVTFQSGALISAMTLGQNLSLPLELYTDLSPRSRDDLIAMKLSLVGLAGFESFYPAEISGGMRKRAALARAIMLDPAYLFFDEPSAGLDPLSSRRLDELIVTLAESMGATVVMVTHELDSIFSIATDAIYLDNASRTLLDQGAPEWLRDHSPHNAVRAFLCRGDDCSTTVEQSHQ